MTPLDRAAWDARLRAEESRLGLADGFRLLYCPWATLGRAEAAFVSLNPARVHPGERDRRLVSDERGPSHAIEIDVTPSPISEQVLRLLRFLGRAPAAVLAGVAAPFRSLRWTHLSALQRRESLRIGLDFWRAALASPRIRLCVAASAPATAVVAEALSARLVREIPSGWGATTLRRFEAPDGRALVALPQLSRWRLFSRPACRGPLEAIFGGLR